MATLSTFFAQLAFAQMLMCALLLAPAWKTSCPARLFSLLMVCGCGYLLDALFGPLERPAVLWWFHFIASNALPGVFWLVALSVFTDRNEPRPWQFMVASLTLLLPLLRVLLDWAPSVDLAALTALHGLLTYGAMALELVLIIHAILVATTHWQSDLVQKRRYMRGTMIGVIAVYLFVVIVVEQVFDLESVWLEAAKHVVLALLMVGVYWLLFSVRRDSLFAPRDGARKAAAPPRATASPEVQGILDAMLVDRLYREEGMTISMLSRHLSIHEYKLRQLINGELGYRNFNDFLNHYRIEEVAGKLADPAFRETTVLTLALDSGFRSLSSFNRAFRNIHGMTPTEFRSRTRFAD